MAAPADTSTEIASKRFAHRREWLAPLMLAAGFGALLLAHLVAVGDSDSSSTLPATILGVVVALAAVTRSTYLIVTTASSDAFRVFRAPHLFLRGGLMFVAATTVTLLMLVRDPFGGFFSYGRITGETVIDVGTFVAAAICLVGSGAALSGAWEARHDERQWHRSVHLHRQHHRPT